MDENWSSEPGPTCRDWQICRRDLLGVHLFSSTLNDVVDNIMIVLQDIKNRERLNCSRPYE